MIRINLAADQPNVGLERKPPVALALVGMLILIAVAAGIGWRYWTISGVEARLTEQIESARAEEKRSSEAAKEIEQLETMRAALYQRIGLVEAARSRQSGPIHLLDHVSRSLPDATWLTRLNQEGSEVLVEGRAESMALLADFVSALESSGVLRQPVAIVTSERASDEDTSLDLVRFSIKATLESGDKRE